MRTPANVQLRMEAARGALERASALLLNPSTANVEACTAALSSAAACLAESRNELADYHGDSALRSEADRLRKAWRLAAHLLATASAYHLVWFQALRARLAGYTVSGAPAELPCASRLCLRG